MKCSHLSISDEAYNNGTPAPVFLCLWPARKLAIVPTWMDRQVGGGMLVRPDLDCASCPCFERQVESSSSLALREKDDG